MGWSYENCQSKNCSAVVIGSAGLAARQAMEVLGPLAAWAAQSGSGRDRERPPRGAAISLSRSLMDRLFSRLSDGHASRMFIDGK